MILSFSEVSSRFSSAGGAYLYTQLAFGRFAGLQMGWMTYFVRAISAAVQANLFTTYLAEFIPGADRGLVAGAITVLLLAILAAVNIRSVSSGAGLSNLTAVVKTVPLLLFGIVGIGWIASGNMVPPPVPSEHCDGLVSSMFSPSDMNWVATSLQLRLCASPAIPPEMIVARSSTARAALSWRR